MRLRTEGAQKVTGHARYIDDFSLPDMLYASTIRSPVSRGILIDIIFKEGINWDEFTIVTAKDIPGKNHIAMIENDWPFLVEKNINHYGEAVGLIAHPDKNMLARAHQFIEVKVEALPGIYQIEESLGCKQLLWKDDNIFKSYLIDKGNIDDVWSKADFIIEGEYSTEAQEHMYIETNGMVAVADKQNGVTVWGSLQCPYYVHGALVPLFGLPQEKVRIIQAETGGGFGGKEDFPSLLAGHTALLAWKSGRPVKMIYSRTEDMQNSTKRHPSRSRHVWALSKEGKILAMDIEFILNGGAYYTLSSVVLSRGAIHAAGPYAIDNVRVDAKAVATNHFPFGAFRGFGAPQSIFATERHMDYVAKVIGMDPIELRLKNFIKKGSQTSTGQVISERVDFKDLISSAQKSIGLEKKQKQFERDNQTSHIKRGFGLAAFFHGAGFTGSGEVYLASVAKARATADGKIHILASSVEMGQGKNTIFTGLAAQALGLRDDDIVIKTPDTKYVPDSGPTVASRTSMIVGKLVETACLGIRDTLIAQGYIKKKYQRAEFIRALKKFVSKNGPFECIGQYQQPQNVHWDDQKYQGAAYATYGWAVYMAQVAVNSLTYETTVEDFVAVQEVGKVLHPLLAEGQIEGGVVQAIGYALYEKVIYEQGRMINNQMTNYIIPTSADVPNIKVIFKEWNKKYGPGGAKGIGELPMDGPAPAILNAISDAIGVDINHIPLMPEDLFLKMESTNGN